MHGERLWHMPASDAMFRGNNLRQCLRLFYLAMFTHALFLSQIAEVVASLEELIYYSRMSNTGPLGTVLSFNCNSTFDELLIARLITFL